MPDLRYAAFDLDGTILDQAGAVLPRLPEAVAALRHQGIVSIIVTGRSVAEFRLFARDPEFASLWHRKALLSNGDVVLDLATGTAEARNLVAPEVLQRARDFGLVDLVAEVDGRYVASSRRAALAFAVLYRFPRSEISRDPARLGDPTGLTRLTVFDEPSRVTEALRDWPCRLDPANGVDATVVTPPDGCKAVALAASVRDWFGEPGLGRVAAFGNDLNDACLIAAAGVGVTVEISHPAAVSGAVVRLDVPLDTYLITRWSGLAVQRQAPAGEVTCQRVCREP